MIQFGANNFTGHDLTRWSAAGLVNSTAMR
jgi:hypothetical protein